jgi:hypothetical protein
MTNKAYFALPMAMANTPIASGNLLDLLQNGRQHGSAYGSMAILQSGRQHGKTVGCFETQFSVSRPAVSNMVQLSISWKMKGLAAI